VSDAKRKYVFTEKPFFFFLAVCGKYRTFAKKREEL
jgi:hypothetical protein